MSYTETVTAAKLAARDVLRAGQISRRLEKVRGYTIELKNFDKDIEAAEKHAKRAEVEARELAADHPDKEDETASAAEVRKEVDETKAQLVKNKESLQKTIDEVTAEIASIEAGDGKVKVDFDKMTELARTFVQERFQESFVAGEYDSAAKKEAKSN